MKNKIVGGIAVCVSALALAGAYLGQELLPIEITASYGKEIIWVPAIIITIIAIGFAIYHARKHPSTSNPAVLKRQELTLELKDAEKKFLKHAIDKPTFDAISKEVNAKLIKIEAEVDAQKTDVQLSKKEKKILDSISTEKRRVLKALLEQKQSKVHELTLAEKSYLKRKIDEKMYRDIDSAIKKEVLTIESQIQAIVNSEEIEKINEELKKAAREIANQESISDKRNLDQFEDEILDQVALEE